VGVLVYVLLEGMNIYKNSACTLPDWHLAALFPFLIAIAGLLYKVYESMQKDRSKNKEEDNDEQ
jgi:predicted histidine transporter YuiF (NhaC family)